VCAFVGVCVGEKGMCQISMKKTLIYKILFLL